MVEPDFRQNLRTVYYFLTGYEVWNVEDKTNHEIKARSLLNITDIIANWICHPATRYQRVIHSVILIRCMVSRHFVIFTTSHQKRNVIVYSFMNIGLATFWSYGRCNYHVETKLGSTTGLNLIALQSCQQLLNKNGILSDFFFLVVLMAFWVILTFG